MFSLFLLVLGGLMILAGSIAKKALSFTTPWLAAVFVFFFFGFKLMALFLSAAPVVVSLVTSLRYIKQRSNDPRSFSVTPLLLNLFRGAGWLLFCLGIFLR